MVTKDCINENITPLHLSTVLMVRESMVGQLKYKKMHMMLCFFCIFQKLSVRLALNDALAEDISLLDFSP